MMVTIALLCAGVHGLCAYTYTYNNKTDLLLRIDVKLYDDADKSGEIAANRSHSVSTKFLIRSWSIEVFLDGKWQQALELTCDLLPGDHTFSIYVKEIREGDGGTKQDWYVIKQ
jgi:hypothetical protein